jgi:hypothetical protein
MHSGVGIEYRVGFTFEITRFTSGILDTTIYIESAVSWAPLIAYSDNILERNGLSVQQTGYKHLSAVPRSLNIS